MSETATKRIALTTLSAPAKKENKEKDKQHESSKAASGRQPELKTHRFVLTLPDSTEESCPEFNFADLLSSVSVSVLYHSRSQHGHPYDMANKQFLWFLFVPSLIGLYQGHNT
jgi:hypothetical protein